MGLEVLRLGCRIGRLDCLGPPGLPGPPDRRSIWPIRQSRRSIWPLRQSRRSRRPIRRSRRTQAAQTAYPAARAAQAVQAVQTKDSAGLLFQARPRQTSLWSRPPQAAGIAGLAGPILTLAPIIVNDWSQVYIKKLKYFGSV